MFYILDGRENFYQWDLNQKLVVTDDTVTEVHFCNKTEDCSLVSEVYQEDGKYLANVPNILLQSDFVLRVYAFATDHTKLEKRFKVISRSKPADYVYTETEIKNYEALDKRISQLNNDLSTAYIVVNTVRNDAAQAQQTANNAGQTAYSVKQTLDYVVEPNLASHEERLDAIEIMTGDIETALNEIKTLQESYIGG